MAALAKKAATAAAAAAAAPLLSNYAKGLSFEELTIELLGPLNFFLRRTGSAGDGGIDFRGHWRRPQEELQREQERYLEEDDVPIVGQCKNESKKLGAVRIREFEAVLLREPRSVGVFASATGYSSTALAHFQSSPVPLILTTISPSSIETFQMNRAASEAIPSVQFGFRFEYEPSGSGFRRVAMLRWAPNKTRAMMQAAV